MGGQCSAISESRAQLCVIVSWEDNCHHSKCPLLPFSPLSFQCWTWNLKSGISLWSAGVSCAGCGPFQLLVQPQPSHCQGSRRREKQPWMCQHYSAISKTSQNCQHDFQPKFKTWSMTATVKNTYSTPVKTSSHSKKWIKVDYLCLITLRVLTIKTISKTLLKTQIFIFNEIILGFSIF